MKIGWPPGIEPGRLWEQLVAAKTGRPPSAEQLTTLLDPGTLLKGRVVQADAAGVVTVATEFGSFKASAARPLAVGREFWFQVGQPGAAPVLAEAGKTHAVLNLLRVVLPEMLAPNAGGRGEPVADAVKHPTNAELPVAPKELLQHLRSLVDEALAAPSEAGKLPKALSQLHANVPVPDRPANGSAAPNTALQGIAQDELPLCRALLDTMITGTADPGKVLKAIALLQPTLAAPETLAATKAIPSTAVPVLTADEQMIARLVAESTLAGKTGTMQLLKNLTQLQANVLPLAGSSAPEGAPCSATVALPHDTQRLIRFLAEHAIDGKPDPVRLVKFIAQLPDGHSLQVEGTDAESAGSRPLSHDLGSPAVSKLVRLLEAHAAVNQHPAPTPGSDYFLFPIFFAEQAGRGEWIFSYEQGGTANRAGGAAISFYLAMTRLGDVHLNLAARQDSLTGVFTLETEEAAAHLRQHLPQLVEALRPLAGAVSITCRVERFDCLKALQADLMAKVGQDNFALVDVRA